MYYYNNELPPQQGWVCPKCGRVNAPWMPTCGCASSQTSGTPYPVKTSSISRDSHEIAKTENSSEKPNNYEPKICDFCRYYNSNIPCGTTPSACKKADKFAKEFVDGLKKLKPKDEPFDKDINVRSKTEPQTSCKTCRYGEVDEGYVRCAYYSKSAEQTEPQTDNSIGCSKCESRYECYDRDMPHAVHCNNYGKITDEPQTDCAWK